MKRRCALLLLLVPWPATAHAQGPGTPATPLPTDEDLDAGPLVIVAEPRVAAGGEGTFHDSAMLGFTWSPLLYGRVAATRQVVFTARWGMAVHRQGEANTVVAPGNPYLSWSYRLRVGDAFLELGLGVTAPVARHGAPERDRAYGIAAAARGLYDRHLWAIDTLSAVTPARLVLDRGRLRARIEAASLTLVGVQQRDGADAAELGLQAAVEIGWIAARWLSLGTRLGATWLATEEEAQLFVTPFARIDFGGGDTWLAFTMNLDEPGGVLLESDSVWGFHIGGGLTL